MGEILREIRQFIRKKSPDSDIAGLGLAIETLRSVSREKKLKMLRYFLLETNVHWDSIKKHQEKFFVEEFTKLFPDYAREMLDPSFRIIVKKQKLILPPDSLDKIWLYTENLVKICIKWLHENRNVLDGGDKKLVKHLDCGILGKEWKIDFNKAVPSSSEDEDDSAAGPEGSSDDEENSESAEVSGSESS